MPTRVVILGSGFGGAYCAQELERRSEDVDVFPADRNNLVVFYPLLIEAGLSREVRVALDWTLDLLFSRDYVPLGVPARSRPRAAPAGASRPERLDGVLERA